jgi:hypothetical protein
VAKKELLFSGPFDIGLFFHQIAEPIPIKFPVTEGAMHFDLAVCHRSHFPIPFAGAVRYIDFLPHLEGVRFENRYNMEGHHFLRTSDCELPHGAVAFQHAHALQPNSIE